MEGEMLAKPIRVRSRSHTNWIKTQPCVICHVRGCEAQHLTIAQPKARGLKAGDQYTMPLCPRHHRELHNHHTRNGELSAEWDFWKSRGFDDPIGLALSFWKTSPDGLQKHGSETLEGRA